MSASAQGQSGNRNCGGENQFDCLHISNGLVSSSRVRRNLLPKGSETRSDKCSIVASAAIDRFF